MLSMATTYNDVNDHHDLVNEPLDTYLVIADSRFQITVSIVSICACLLTLIVSWWIHTDPRMTLLF